MAYCLEQGKAIKMDTERSAVYFQLASEQGYAKAQNSYAIHCESQVPKKRGKEEEEERKKENKKQRKKERKKEKEHKYNCLGVFNSFV